MRRSSRRRRVVKSAGALTCVSIAALWLWSGWYSVGVHLGNRGLIHFQGGTLLFQLVQAARYEADDFLSTTWFPESVPRAGVHRVERFHVAWELPGIHREFCSPIGEWWLIRLPLWLVLAIAGIRAVRRLHALWRDRTGAHRRTRMPSGGDRHVPGVARALLWVSLTTSVVILVAWIASGWWGLCFNCRGIFVVEVERGCVTLLNDLENVRGYWGEDVWCHIRRADGFSLRWTPPHTASCAQSTYGTWGEINVPFWVLFLGAGVPVFLAIRSRRHPSGHCQRCGYDLTGNVSGRCPECGAVVGNEGGVEAEDRVGDT